MASWTRKEATKIWGTESNARAKELEEIVKGNLRRTSENLANLEELKRVEVKHVNIAFEALAKLGLLRRRLIDRPDVFMAAGGFFIGAAWACPDVISLLIKSEGMAEKVAIGAMTASFFFGAFLWVLSVYLSRLPPVVSDEIEWTTRLRHFAVWGVGILMLLAIGYLTWARFFANCPNCGKGGEQVPTPAQADDVAPLLPE